MNVHEIIAEVAKQLTAVSGNALEALTTQIGYKAAAWAAIKPLHADMAKAFAAVAKNAGKSYGATQFNADMVKRATDEGETWDYTDDQIKGLIAFRVHSTKTESGYKTWCSGNRVVASIDGYTDHLIDIDRGWKTNTGLTTADRQSRLDENKAARATKLQKARADIDISTFYGAGDDVKAKLQKARKVRDAALQEISLLEAELAVINAAKKAATTTAS